MSCPLSRLAPDPHIRQHCHHEQEFSWLTFQWRRIRSYPWTKDWVTINKWCKQVHKCISSLARRKSYHTALIDDAAPSSECPASVVHNSEPPNNPHRTPLLMSPLTHQKMRSSASAARFCCMALAASAYHSHTPMWVMAALSAFLSLVTLTFDLWPP